MAIRVSQRKVSEIEYENTYYKVYAYITGKAKHLPKRHMHYIGEPMNRKLNEIYEKIARCTDYYLHDKGKSADRYRICESILVDFDEVMRISYFWWNVSSGNNEVKYVKQNQREFWAGLINKEISLLSGVMRKCRKKNGAAEAPIMKAYRKSELKKAVFLEKLAELQNIIYKRAIRQGKDFRDAQMEMLVKLSRDAFYNALEGNSIAASNGNLYKKRMKYFSDAIGNLYAMNRPFRELCFEEVFSEKEMSELCNRVTECLKILQALQKSDKERFMDGAAV